MTMATLLFVLLAVFAGSNLLFRIVKHSGLKGALFGAAIGSTVGQVDLGGGALSRKRVKIHRLVSSSPDEPVVGLEIAQSPIGSFSMVPVALNREEAVTLARLLTEAAER